MAGGAALGGISQWMALMAEHMSHDQARLPFLWPKLNTGKPGQCLKLKMLLTQILKVSTLEMGKLQNQISW